MQIFVLLQFTMVLQCQIVSMHCFPLLRRCFLLCSIVVHKLNSNCVDERESVQKKTFTKWVNSHLSRVGCKIQDLYVDLRDGKMLIKLLEVLSGERLVCYHMLYLCLILMSIGRILIH